MLPNVKLALFAALDRADHSQLTDHAALRGGLYDIATHHGEPITEDLDGYIEMLIDEFCVDRGVSKQR